MHFESIIGLEIHIQLKTASKMFCACTNGVETPPNTAICPVCMGHPGTLPAPNNKALTMALRMALALHGTINARSKFDRKHYFYPDLPKGYQISQYDEPLSTGGFFDITVDGKEKRIALTRLHVEEDAAKLHHDTTDPAFSLVDYNRAGTPLIEIVTEPDFRSPEEAKVFLQELRLLARYLAVSDADMEKGHLRCDANISLRPSGTKEFFAKTEVKNMNSFRAVERALAYEIQRQTKLWDDNTRPHVQETRGWNDTKQITEAQRTKEEAHDYRYFPEPDIPPLTFTKETIEEVRAHIPELPQAKLARFMREYEMPAADARTIIEYKALADWTEAVLSELRAWLQALEGEGTEAEKWERGKGVLVRLTTGWITSKLLARMHTHAERAVPENITPENFAELISLISTRRVNSTAAQHTLDAMLATGVDPSDHIEAQGLAQIDDEETLRAIIETVLDRHPDVVETYTKGKGGALQFLVGQVMKETKGTANPQRAETMLKKRIPTSRKE